MTQCAALLRFSRQDGSVTILRYSGSIFGRIANSCALPFYFSCEMPATPVSKIGIGRYSTAFMTASGFSLCSASVRRSMIFARWYFSRKIRLSASVASVRFAERIQKSRCDDAAIRRVQAAQIPGVLNPIKFDASVEYCSFLSGSGAFEFPAPNYITIARYWPHAGKYRLL